MISRLHSETLSQKKGGRVQGEGEENKKTVKMLEINNLR
jgi:hypothetical protein